MGQQPIGVSNRIPRPYQQSGNSHHDAVPELQAAVGRSLHHHFKLRHARQRKAADDQRQSRHQARPCQSRPLLLVANVGYGRNQHGHGRHRHPGHRNTRVLNALNKTPVISDISDHAEL